MTLVFGGCIVISDGIWLWGRCVLTIHEPADQKLAAIIVQPEAVKTMEQPQEWLDVSLISVAMLIK